MQSTADALLLEHLPERAKDSLCALRVSLEDSRVDPAVRRAAIDYLCEKVCPKCGRLYEEFCQCWMD